LARAGMKIGRIGKCYPTMSDVHSWLCCVQKNLGFLPR
jgi:hypothetical protein